MTAVPKPPVGFDTWLDFAVAYGSGEREWTEARAELDSLLSRLSAAEARAERLRKAIMNSIDDYCPSCASTDRRSETRRNEIIHEDGCRFAAALSADAGKEARNA